MIASATWPAADVNVTLFEVTDGHTVYSVRVVWRDLELPDYTFSSPRKEYALAWYLYAVNHVSDRIERGEL